ncbi:MAG: methyltransferase domain-containing protein [Christensenellales bacterium]|jgi:16S rRNA G966 N2-methylase RsmD
MERKSGRIRPAIDKESLDTAWARVFSEDAQSALSELCAQAKDARVQEYLNAKPKRPKLRTLLTHEKPKVRKNAARLLGELYLPGDLEALKNALFAEETRFVLPSIVLALGNAGEAAAQNLSQFAKNLPPVNRPEDEKHHAQLQEALFAARSRCEKQQPREFTGLKAPAEVVFTVQPGCEKLLVDEAQEKGICLKRTPLGHVARVTDYPELFVLRTFEEALFPLGAIAAPREASRQGLAEWAGAARPAAIKFLRLLSSCLSGGQAYPYRIELRGEVGDRKALISALVAVLGETGGLINAPSGYDAEFRVVCQKGKAQLFAKLYVPQDPRFAYRKGAVSASIHPVNAAALMRFALPHLKEGARVIDPCCGSGTLLIERVKLGLPVADLLGVDIDGAALDIARKNAEAAGVSAGFVRADSTRFVPKQPFDELFANLPFGTRVGTAKKNAVFYRGLIQQLDRLLSPDGVAVFYTTQFVPLSRLLAGANYQVVDTIRFEAGGLSPFGIIAKRKQSK